VSDFLDLINHSVVDTDSKLGTGSSDNYAYLVTDDKSKDAIIIDPANPEELVQSPATKGVAEILINE
jgi:hypothetical protein